MERYWTNFMSPQLSEPGLNVGWNVDASRDGDCRPNGRAIKKISSIRRSSTIFAFIDSDTAAISDPNYGKNGLYQITLRHDRMKVNFAPRHSGGVNIVFGDGHTCVQKYSVLLSMNDACRCMGQCKTDIHRALSGANTQS